MTRSNAFPPLPSARIPRRTPPALGRWPVAVIAAERLRGSLVSCGPGYRPIGWPENPRIRLAALEASVLLGHSDVRLIAVSSTAAWVWGVARAPRTPLEFSTQRRQRYPHIPPPGVVIHEYALDTCDASWFGGLGVAAPIRVICDLLRTPGEFSRSDRVACRLLLLRIDRARHAVTEALQRGPLRHRQVALRRLAAL